MQYLCFHLSEDHKIICGFIFWMDILDRNYNKINSKKIGIQLKKISTVK